MVLESSRNNSSLNNSQNPDASELNRSEQSVYEYEKSIQILQDELHELRQTMISYQENNALIG
jgi:hypothetical protein